MNGTYNGEDMTIHFTAEPARCDYGVKVSPEWSEPVNIQVESFELFGSRFESETFAVLPARMRGAMLAMADEVDFELDAEIGGL